MADQNHGGIPEAIQETFSKRTTSKNFEGIPSEISLKKTWRMLKAIIKKMRMTP